MDAGLDLSQSSTLLPAGEMRTRSAELVIARSVEVSGTINMKATLQGPEVDDKTHIVARLADLGRFFRAMWTPTGSANQDLVVAYWI